VTGDRLGAAVIVADVDGDGDDDLLTVAPAANGEMLDCPSCGDAYVVFGGARPLCPVLPGRVELLHLSRRGDDLELSWPSPLDPAVERVAVFDTRDKGRVPDLSRAGVEVTQSGIIYTPCPAVPRSQDGCTLRRWITDPILGVIYFRARALCADGSEGPE